LTRAQEADLRKAAPSEPEFERQIRTGLDRCFEETLPLHENDVLLVQLIPQSGTSGR
jgi:hypothetical protein